MQPTVVARRRSTDGGEGAASPPRGAGVAAAGLLGAGAAFHAYYAYGHWPFASREAALGALVGEGATDPPTALFWGIALALVAAAGLVLGRAGVWRRGPVPGRVYGLGTWAMAVVLALRGIVGVAGDLASGLETAQARFDLAVYSPVALVLAGLCLVVARGGPRSGR